MFMIKELQNNNNCHSSRHIVQLEAVEVIVPHLPPP